MARPLRIQYPGAYYHVTSRGNEKKIIFGEEKDRQQFLAYLESAVVRYGAKIHVWCLMGNHYHLLLETPNGNLSQIMRHINGAYTTYYNIKQKMSGHLFQGRYKAILIEADRYATELSRYIHLNPVRAEIVNAPEKYPWSSYRCYIGRSKAPTWLETGFILSYFGDTATAAKHGYSDFVATMLKQEYDNPLQTTVASTLLGTPDFITEISEKYLKNQHDTRNIPAVGKLRQRPSMETILSAVAKHVPESSLRRNICIYCCQKYSGAKLKEIGLHFGISDAAVSQTTHRLLLKAKNDQELKTLLQEVTHFMLEHLQTSSHRFAACI